MKIQNVVICAVLAAVPSSAFAYSQDDKVVEIGSWNDGHAVVKFEGADKHDCDGDLTYNGPWFSLGTSSEPEKRKNMLAIATTALATGKTVNIITGGCSASGNEEIVIFISIKK